MPKEKPDAEQKEPGAEPGVHQLSALGTRWDDLLRANDALCKVWETESEEYLKAGLRHALRVARSYTRELEAVIEAREG